METLFGPISSHIRVFLETTRFGDTVELEARLGRLCNPITHERISFDTPHPVVFGKGARGMVFNSGVDQQFFEKLKGRCGGFPVVRSRDCVSVLENNFRKIESDVSTVYQKKFKSSFITIYCPGHSYDVRVSFSNEIEVSPNEVAGLETDDETDHSGVTEELENGSEEKIKKYRATKPVKHVRHRERESFVLKDYVFDFTKVNKSKKTQNAKVTYEVEIEVKNPDYPKDEFISMILNLARDEKSGPAT